MIIATGKINILGARKQLPIRRVVFASIVHRFRGTTLLVIRTSVALQIVGIVVFPSYYRLYKEMSEANGLISLFSGPAASEAILFQAGWSKLDFV